MEIGISAAAVAVNLPATGASDEEAMLAVRPCCQAGGGAAGTDEMVVATGGVTGAVACGAAHAPSSAAARGIEAVCCDGACQSVDADRPKLFNA